MFMNLVSWPTLAFLCFMVGLAGFVDASAGGGGLISLPAYMVTGLPVHLLYGANKFSSACGTTFASAMFFRSGALDLQVALIAAAASFAGSTLGSRLVLLLPGEVLKIMGLVMLPIIFTQRKLPEEDRSSQVPRKKALTLAVVIGLLIGLYDGLVGPGTGTFAIIAFTSVLKFDLRTASGNAKVLNVIMLGVYVGYTEVVSPEVVWSTIEHKMAKKPKLLPLNKQAFEAGLKIGKEAQNRQ